MQGARQDCIEDVTKPTSSVGIESLLEFPDFCADGEKKQPHQIEDSNAKKAFENRFTNKIKKKCH